MKALEFVNGKLVLSGRIDSANAPELEAQLNEILANNSFTSLEVDCENLKYISSAGLRLILKLRKACAGTEITNVCPEVCDIFQMTGFTEMMEVHKAFKVVSIEGCEVIGQGANGKVYRIDPETIVKAYINQDSLPDIKRERELARKAFVMGVPTAISYDVVRLKEGGYGSVFELLQATGLNKILASGEKSLDEVARMSINLLKIIHSCEVEPGSLPDMKQEVLSWVEFDRHYLPEDQYGKLLNLVSAIPDDNHLLHGDYHMKNVLYQDGECLLIDMDTLCHGNPVFELAQMYNGYCGFSYLDHNISMKFYGVSHEIVSAFWKKSLSLYLGTDDEKKIAEVEKKAMVIGFTRILRRAVRKMKPGSEEQTATMENARKILAQLLEEVDSLAV
ncbi:MAG: STAS domain-containing protein [Spirochaetales bacterium]|nr:STAS domain-containing protein [Spirochaetales bacterium]